MRVLFVTPYGFNERLWYFTEFVLARNLAKLGWRVSACVLAEDSEPIGIQEREGVIVARVIRKRDSLRYMFHLIRQSQLIHIFHLRNGLGLIAFCVAKLLKKPVVFSEYGLLHDPFIVCDRDDPLSYPIMIRNLRSNFRSLLFHLPMLGADRIVFLSRHNIEIARQIGLNIAKVLWLPPIIDFSRFTEVETIQISNCKDEPFALFVGQMKLRKGWDILLHAISHVPPSVLPKFVFVSPSSLKPPLPFAELIKRLGISERVVYIGKASNKLLGSLYSQCSLVVVPSRYEGFGLVALEAFEARKPVVASDVVALNETLEHGFNAYLVPPKDHIALADALVTVASNEKLKHQLIEGGQKTLCYFEVNKWLPRWQKVYEDLLQ